jgi:hypothetical protein
MRPLTTGELGPQKRAICSFSNTSNDSFSLSFRNLIECLILRKDSPGHRIKNGSFLWAKLAAKEARDEAAHNHQPLTKVVDKLIAALAIRVTTVSR